MGLRAAWPSGSSMTAVQRDFYPAPTVFYTRYSVLGNMVDKKDQAPACRTCPSVGEGRGPHKTLNK